MAILILCDQPDELDAMLQLAGDAGFDAVNGFKHPAAALDWCETHVPDLVLVDFLMRASDGLEVIRRLRAMPALGGVPLVLMLPHGFEAVSAAAIAQGASDFLAKPVDPSEFVSRARNLLELRRLRALSGPGAERWHTGATQRMNVVHVH